MKIEFEKPTHGCMPVKVAHGGTEELFEVSNVPNDPIHDLIYVLESAIGGRGGEVWWHLEPSGYYLSIDAENDNFRVKFEYSKESKAHDREMVFLFVGSFDEVIVRLWRDLRQLQSKNWNEFSIAASDLDRITREVKRRRIC